MHINDIATNTILRTYAANYSIMQIYGYTLSKPIALLGSEEDYKSQITCLTNYRLKIIDILVKNRTEDILEESNIDFIGIIYPGGCVSKWREKVKDFTMRLYSDLMDKSPPVLVFSDGRILNECREDFYFIHVGHLSENRVLLDEIVPKDEDLSLVINMINKIASKGATQIERVLVAAVCFMYPNLYTYGKADEFEKLAEYARFLAGQSEAGSSEDVAELFIEECYKWQRKIRFTNIFELPQIEMEVIDKIDEAIFYNKEFIFVSESLFKQIVSALLNIYPENILKFALVQEGILKPENTKTATSKMNYRSIAGTYERVRMLKFQRSEFVMCGELDFVSLCLLNKEAE